MGSDFWPKSEEERVRTTVRYLAFSMASVIFPLNPFSLFIGVWNLLQWRLVTARDFSTSHLQRSQFMSFQAERFARICWRYLAAHATGWLG